MRIVLSILIFIGSLYGNLCAETVSRSFSASRQFVVYGEDLKTRGAFCTFAEDTKQEYLAIFEHRDVWKWPIVIHIKRSVGGLRVARNVVPRLSQVGNEYRLELHILLGPGFTRAEARQEFIRLLIAEEILRDDSRIGAAQRQDLVPAWLHIGIAETLNQIRLGHPSDLYAAILESHHLLSISEILNTRPEKLDSISAAIFNASACGFVQALLAQPNGNERLRLLMEDMGAYDGSMERLVLQHFPGLNSSNNSIEKWWTLQVANLSQPTAYETFSPLETEKRLSEALILHFQTGLEEEKKGLKLPWAKKSLAEPVNAEEMVVAKAHPMSTIPIERFQELMKHPGRKTAFDECRIRLLELSTRAFPAHAPIIREYREILTRLQKGKKWKIEKRLRELKELRTYLKTLSTDVEDYLNWFEATQMETKSGEFHNFRKAADQANQSPPKRKDGISKYLDAMEEEFR